MSDEVEQLANLFVTVICALLIMLIIGIVFWTRSHVGEVQTRGSAIAIADKIMYAPCLAATDVSGKIVPFFFEKSALDSYNNTKLPDACLSLPGSMYFVEVSTATDRWVFNSMNLYPYAYNARVRGLTRECKENGVYSDASGMRSVFPNPFNMGSDYAAGILRYSASVRSGEDISIANVLVIVDPDSGTWYYPEGFPLCMKDVICPPNAQGKCKCINEKKYIAPGSDCATGAETEVA